MVGGFRSWGKAEDLCRVGGAQPQSEGPQWAGEWGRTLGVDFYLSRTAFCFHSPPFTSQKGARGLRGKGKVTLIECVLYTKHFGNILLFCLLHKPESIIPAPPPEERNSKRLSDLLRI